MGIQPLTEVQAGLQGRRLEINTLSIRWLSLPGASQQRSLGDGLQVKPASRTQTGRERQRTDQEEGGGWQVEKNQPGPLPSKNSETFPYGAPDLPSGRCTLCGKTLCSGSHLMLLNQCSSLQTTIALMNRAEANGGPRSVPYLKCLTSMTLYRITTMCQTFILR